MENYINKYISCSQWSTDSYMYVKHQILNEDEDEICFWGFGFIHEWGYTNWYYDVDSEITVLDKKVKYKSWKM